MQILEAGIAALLGALTWTLVEYALHRFVFHAASPAMLGAREHRQHHANPDYFAPWWQKALAALAAMALVGPLSIAVAGAGTGLAFSLAFIATYGLYELLHRRVHTHPPRSAYGRWRRRNHLAHHFRDPRRAQGVTVPLWDAVFGTRLPLTRVRVPRRLATRWMLDERGQLHASLAGDYELVGTRARDAASERQDSAAAIANRPPAAERA